MILCDNDVISKSACYGELDELVWTQEVDSKGIGVLGAAPFVIRRKIQKGNIKGDRDAALKLVDAFMARAHKLEPTEKEQQIAADLESAAQQRGVSLDVGESQLCAILVERNSPLLLTGDKR